ncbi:LOW QUALITY PROTEIN: protocadherin-11 X-linked-like [Pomacea canaliculata]|uniref:LOW QUALITY PROTEIN: protocadherin-11 X-linked-like n=1 Tax=Pomacea canaliculata TaxID=400727 RepID=UPI000D733A82|nr:LOW QUALITY PROTEIN: protocadherin-11 X-linked-like [Pomacea canaliculata]
MVVEHAGAQSAAADLIFNIMEEQQTGTLIGRLSQNEILFRGLTQSQRQQLKYESSVLPGTGVRASRAGVVELATVGTVLKLSGAADRDYDSNNTVQRYALTAYTDVFAISSSTNLDGSSLLDLTLLQPLDRETVSAYSFAIVAYDGGSPPLSAALEVEIRVSDENDNAPVFLNSSYFVEIRDEVILDQPLLQVSARDMDEGANGQVMYRFSSLQREQMEQKFHVDETSGVITAMSPLQAGRQNFIIEALDGGSPPLKSQTVVTINVVSSRNNPPSVQINTLSNGSNAFVEIPEDSVPGAFIAFIVADDPDYGSSGSVSCLLDNRLLRLGTIQGKGYTLTLQGGVDRERQDRYNVTVTCSDKGDPPMSTSKSLLLIITDVNDNAPVFTRLVYSQTVSEGIFSDRFLLKVTADDIDSGRNADLVYSLEPSVRQTFRVDPSTGQISATGELDRETTPFISFRVFARDNGDRPLTGTAEVRITLRGCQRPVSDGAEPFQVEPNGTVWSSGGLDRELRDSYTFTVMVRDKGTPPKTTYASVVVTVLDVNDNVPMVQFPLSDNHTVLISTPPEPGMVLGRIVAYDPDLGLNRELRFAIVEGDEDGALDIDPFRGEEHQRKRKADDYIIIVAGVAGTTVVLSAIIIAAICFIFREDRRQRTKHAPSSGRTGSSGNGGFFRNLNVPENLSDDEKLRPNYDDDLELKCKPDTRTERRKGPRMAQAYRSSGGNHYGLMGPGDRGEFLKQQHSFLVRQLDEVASDASGDSGTGDSGRGGSEDDVNLEHFLHAESRNTLSTGMTGLSPAPSAPPTGDISRFPPPRAPKGEKLQALPRPVRPSATEGSLRSPRDATLSNRRSQPFVASSAARESPAIFARDSAGFVSPSFRQVSLCSDHPDSPRVLSTFTTQKPVSFTFQKPGGSAASMDEDMSTTTSGSYTVNPEELRMEGYVGGDVVV